MKKTIIITVAMLCVFGAVVMFGADRVSTDWQQPQQDDVEISSSSPVEQVENELKIYKFIPVDWYGDVEADFQEGMISAQEALGYGCTAMEKVFSHINLADVTFGTAIINYAPYGAQETTPTYVFESVIEGKENIYPFNLCHFTVDAYTGEVTSLLFGEDIKHERPITQFYRSEKELLEYITQISESLGYEKFEKYYFENIKDTEYNGTDYKVFLLTEGEELLCFKGNTVNSDWSFCEHDGFTKEYIEFVKQNGKDFASEG